MNRGEALGFGAIVGFGSIGLYYAVLYFFVFQNFLVVTKQLGYDMYPVEIELWWFFFGFGMILGLRALTKSYKWARRSFCDHCGKELKK